VLWKRAWRTLPWIFAVTERQHTEVSVAEEQKNEPKGSQQEIALLSKVAARLASTLDIRTLLELILKEVDVAFGFQHSMLLLTIPGEEKLRCEALRGYGDAKPGSVVAFGEGVIGVVAKRRKLIRMNSIARTRRYVMSAAGGNDAPTIALPGLENANSSVAIPLLARDDLVGVLAVESPEAGMFARRDEALVEGVANLAALAIVNAQMHGQEVERRLEQEALNAALEAYSTVSGRFVPHGILTTLGYESLRDVRRGDSRELDMGVLFSDIRGFTALVEGQTTQENFAFINDYLEHMEDPIRANKGFVDSYQGDAVMALFPNPADAVLAAIDSMTALGAFNEQRAQSGLGPVRVGIGVASGPLMLGIKGGRNRLQLGVIGDAANTASRVESLTKRYGASILVTGRTLDSTERTIQARAVDHVIPKGKQKPITVWEVLDGIPESERAAKLASLDEFDRGRAQYEAGDPGASLVHFANVLRDNPGDRASQLYIGRCWRLIETGIPDGWTGVAEMTTK
jgi:adenylate cyclase